MQYGLIVLSVIRHSEILSKFTTCEQAQCNLV